MNNQQVQNFFYDKKDTPCPITESLIKSGYQQEREGYIAYAKNMVLKLIILKQNLHSGGI